MKVLFLDFDGALNSHNFNNSISWSSMPPERNPDMTRNPEYLARTLDPVAMQRLSKILTAVPELKIILTTTWRHAIGNYNIIKAFAGHGIDLQIYGEISREYWTGDRHLRIIEWLESNDPVLQSDFVVLDDMPLEFPRELCVKLLSGQSMAASERITKAFVKTDSQVGLQDRDVEKVLKLLKGNSYDS